jgi:hypothetical protein
VIEWTARPRAAEVALALGAALSAVWSVVALLWTDSTDPFAAYDANPGIRAITLAALALDLVLLVAIASSSRGWTRARQALVLGCAAIGIALPWLELWWGSTFYYGEVRDKQGLPFSVNHGGIVGSVLFAAYIAWRLRFGRLRGGGLALARVGAVVAIGIVEWLCAPPLVY